MKVLLISSVLSLWGSLTFASEDMSNDIVRSELVQEATTAYDEQLAFEMFQKEQKELVQSDDPNPAPSTVPSPAPSFPPLPPITTWPTLPGMPTTGTGGFNLDLIVNLAMKVWEIVKEGRPLFTANSNNANALPEGARSAWDLQGWVSQPKVAVYKIKYYNAFNKEAGHFHFRLMFTYGGTVRGKGRYLSSVKIVPDRVNLNWGSNLDVKVEVVNTIAIGDARNPTAQMELLLGHHLSTHFRTLAGSMSFAVKGDGTYRELGGFSNLR